jgi:GAF domain-containing protein
MRRWLAVPLIGSDGENYGFFQASDRLEGDFTVQDKANLVRLASLTSTPWTRSRNYISPSTGRRSADGWGAPEQLEQGGLLRNGSSAT